MTIILWIRHGEKEYSNGKNPNNIYQHDPGIIENTYDDIRLRGKYLIDTFGIPNIIYTSPFKRTRITATLLSEICPDVKIQIEPQLGEFLGNQKPITSDIPDVETDTLKHLETFLGEDFYDFKTRAINISKNLHYQSVRSKEKIIWIVTHSLIIKTISAHYRFKIDKPSILSGVVFQYTNKKYPNVSLL